MTDDATLLQPRGPLGGRDARPLPARLAAMFSPARHWIEVPSARLVRQMGDYARSGQALFWQRHSMYAGSCALTGFYYDHALALLFYCTLLLAELADSLIAGQILGRETCSAAEARLLHRQLLVSAIFGSSTVALFAIVIALMEGHTTHFVPLFFLFAAGLFAAINNHQLPRILYTRIGIYAFAFLFIPSYDLIVTRPPLASELWLQLGTVGFVLFFVLECSQIFLRLYSRALDQMDELRAERDRARAAYEVKSHFVSIVSHELRTPLTSILGSLSLLQSGAFAGDAGQRAEVIEIAYKNSKRLSDLINDLLDLQKIESGQMRYVRAPVDLAELAADTLRMIEGYADQKRIDLRLIDGGEAATADVDRQRIEQVLCNLLSNAIKFSRDEGRVETRVVRTPDTVVLEVRDEGLGIPPGSEDLVFGQFAQVDASDHRAYQGTGLGLSISRKIVEAHGGWLGYESVYGEGTLFRLELPRKAGADAAGKA